MSPVPEVLWVCRWMGTETVSFNAFTREYASMGSSRFAMSLMQMASAPISSSSFARRTKYASL